MRTPLAFALFPALLAQETGLVPVDVHQLKPLLDFEAGPPGGIPKGWSTSPGKVSIDDKVVHRGQFSARLQRGSAITLMVPVTFSGDFLTLRGFLKTEGVTEFAGLWLRVDGNSGNPVGYENMRSQGLRGSTDWREYSIRIPLASNGTYVYFGVLTEGGTTWADDLELLIDGRPVWDVPPKTLAAAQPLTSFAEIGRGTCLIVRGREARPCTENPRTRAEGVCSTRLLVTRMTLTQEYV